MAKLLRGYPWLLLALTALVGSAQADPIIHDTFVDVNIYYGVVQLYSPTNVLLSTTMAMTVEAQFDYALVQATGESAILAYFMPLMDQSVAQQLANNPSPGSPPIPAYISNNLPSFANSTGFGAEVQYPPAVFPPTPDTTPTPSAQQLYQTLTTQPVPFVVTADSGFVQLGGTFDFVYAFGPFGPLPNTTADTIEGGTTVEIFERDIQLQQTTVPEPSSLGPLGIAIGLMLRKQFRRSPLFLRS
jgi:hypothetical protein